MPRDGAVVYEVRRAAAAAWLLGGAWPASPEAARLLGARFPAAQPCSRGRMARSGGGTSAPRARGRFGSARGGHGLGSSWRPGLWAVGTLIAATYPIPKIALLPSSSSGSGRRGPKVAMIASALLPGRINPTPASEPIR